MQPVKPFDDPKVRKAMRSPPTRPRSLESAHRGIGTAAEHHHVSPVHPDYEKLPVMTQNIEKAKKLLADAGHKDGIDIEIFGKSGSDLGGCVPCSHGRAMEGSRHPGQDQRPAIGQVLGDLDHCPIRLHDLGAPAAGLHGASPLPTGPACRGTSRTTPTRTSTRCSARRRERSTWPPAPRLIGQLEEILQDDGPIVQPLWRSLFTYHDKRVQGFKMHPTRYIFANQLAISA